MRQTPVHCSHRLCAAHAHTVGKTSSFVRCFGSLFSKGLLNQYFLGSSRKLLQQVGSYCFLIRDERKETNGGDGNWVVSQRRAYGSCPIQSIPFHKSTMSMHISLCVFLTRVFMHFKNRVVVMKLLINQLKRISLVVDATTAWGARVYGTQVCFVMLVDSGQLMPSLLSPV